MRAFELLHVPYVVLYSYRYILTSAADINLFSIPARAIWQHVYVHVKTIYAARRGIATYVLPYYLLGLMTCVQEPALARVNANLF